MKKIIFLIIFFSIIPFSVFATSGACSSHGGVNCSASVGLYGKVICNDGWTNSSVYYSSMSECVNSMDCPIRINDENLYNQLKQENNDAITKIKADNQISCDNYFQQLENSNNNLYQNCVTAVQSATRLSGGMNLVTTDCGAEKATRTEQNMTIKASCLHNSDDIIFKYQLLNSCITLDKTNHEVNCQTKYGDKSFYNAFKNTCDCQSGYITVNGGKCILADSYCVGISGQDSWFNFSTMNCNHCEQNGIKGKRENGQCVFSPIISTPTETTIVPTPQPQVIQKPTQTETKMKENPPTEPIQPIISNTASPSKNKVEQESLTPPQEKPVKKSWFKIAIEKIFNFFGL